MSLKPCPPSSRPTLALSAPATGATRRQGSTMLQQDHGGLQRVRARFLSKCTVRDGVIGRFVPRITLRARSDWELRANLRRIEVEGSHVGTLRSAGVPVVVSGQDDVVPAQRRDVPEQARFG